MLLCTLILAKNGGGGGASKCPQDLGQWKLLVYSEWYNLNSPLFVTCFHLVQLNLCKYYGAAVPFLWDTRETLSDV